MGGLPALSIQPIQQESILSKLGKMQQLKGQQQNIQEGQLDIEAKQRAVKDQATTMQILAKHGGNLKAALPDLAQNVSAQQYIGLAKSSMEIDKNAADLAETQAKTGKLVLDNELTRHNEVLGIISAAKQLDPQTYAQQFPAIAQRFLELEPKAQGKIDPAQPIPQTALDSIGMLYQTQTTALAAAKANQEAQSAADTHASKLAGLPGEQANSAKAVKVNAGTDAAGLTAENRVQQQQARAVLSENARHNKEMESVAGDRLSKKDTDFIDKTYVKPANDVEKSYQMFMDAYNNRNNAKTGAESMLALSTHLATTFGNVKGARVTKDMIEHHLGARGIGDKALVAVQNITNGDVLSPDQWDAFKGLITQSRNLTWDTVKKEADRRGVDVSKSVPSDGKANDPFAQFGGKPR